MPENLFYIVFHNKQAISLSKFNLSGIPYIIIFVYMETLEKITGLRHGLGSFTNPELYYIISNLLGLGGLGEHMIEREKLLISFDEYPDDDFVPEIRFCFMSKLPMITATLSESKTTFCFGKLTSDFEIELTTGRAGASSVDPDDEHHDIEKILCLAREHTHKYDPLRFAKGLENLMCTDNFLERNLNNLFKFNGHTKLDNRYRQYLALGSIGDTNYSGSYYLVVEPSALENINSNIINNFSIAEEGENVGNLTTCCLTTTEIKEFESNKPFVALSEFDDLEARIANRIRLALSDCSEERISELFENMSEHEFIQSRVDVYLSVLIPAKESNSYQPTGAEEIAWHECANDIRNEF